MFREDITNYVKKGVLYVPKNGGLNDYVQKLLPEIGVDSDGETKSGKLELRKARGEDIAMRVEDTLKRGTPAYGLTGDDLFDEYMLQSDAGLVVLNTYDWFDENAEYKRPALCLMNRGNKQPSRVAVNKKYEKTSEKFLNERFDEYDIRMYAGGTEETVLDGTNDACIDIVYTGSERKKQGLKVEEIVRFSDISLIGGNMEEKREITPDYNKRGGLLPVITQDFYTNEVLMLAYANEEALEKTAKTGYATFYSTSRNELWTKGEGSGNQMKVIDMMVDCDQDAILYKVETPRGACHTTDSRGKKRTSCFYRTADITMPLMDPMAH